MPMWLATPPHFPIFIYGGSHSKERVFSPRHFHTVTPIQWFILFSDIIYYKLSLWMSYLKSLQHNVTLFNSPGMCKWFHFPPAKFPCVPLFVWPVKEESFCLLLHLYLFLNTYLAALHLVHCLSCRMWDIQSSLQHARSLVATCRILFPNQGSNPGPLHWDCRVLATGPPEKSLYIFKWMRQKLKNISWHENYMKLYEIHFIVHKSCIRI